MTYEERMVVEQQRDALRRQRDYERMNGVAGVRANDSRIAANNDAMHGRAGRKWLGGEAGAVSSGDALHGQAGRKWLGGGDQQTQNPRGHISFFASDGQGRISRGDNASGEMQIRDTDVWGNDWRLRMYAEQKASYDEMGQVMQTVRQKNAQQQIGLQGDISSLMKYAQGGVIPEELRQLVNRKYGFDGVKSGLLPSSGFASGGDFNLYVANGVDRNGNVQVQTIGINPFQQYSMMQMNDAAFDDNDRAALRQRLKQNYGYSDRELAAVERMRVHDLKKQYEQRKMELENREKELKIQRQEQELARALGQKSLTDAQKYALSHYKDFTGYRKATKDDVVAGRAKKIGEPAFAVDEDVANGLASEIGAPLQMSNEDGFNAAVDFYNRTMQNQDPATNPQGGQGGQQPAPGNEVNPLAPGSEAQPPATPVAGGEAAPEQTATPSPSATATPPAEGQGELDFGGGEPEAAPAATQTTTQTIASEEEDERKRRQAAKPKSNSWKNSALFK